MAQAKPSKLGPITLDELIALNDEIAALARAGVPLESALAELGADMPGRLGKIVTTIAQETSRGESLPQVFSRHSAGLPPVYRAVVEAGLRTGRLSSALEALAGSIRRVAETRRAVAMAAIYPLLVLIFAWGLFAFFIDKIAPGLLSALGSFGGMKPLMAMVARAGATVIYWGPAVPVVVLIAGGLWWSYSGRAAMVESHWAGRLLGWLPWMGATLRWSRNATFAEVLAMLVESEVPLHEAVVLAAQSAGEKQTIAAAEQLAAVLERGERWDRSRPQRLQFPPLLLWLISAGDRHGELLLPAMQSAAQTYRRRARHQADLARLFLPVLLTVAIGGTATLIYALALFWPYTSILRTLAEP